MFKIKMVHFLVWTSLEPSVICAVPRGHFGICDSLPQVMLKPKIHVDIHGPIAGAQLTSVA